MLKKIKIQGKSFVEKIIWSINGGYKPKKFWNTWSKTFMDDPWQVDTHPQHEWLLQKIDIKSQKSILEVGCGFGRNMKYLIDQGINPKRITGVDISPEMIKKARKYLRKGSTLKTGNILELPFKDNSFDLVFTHGVLMHVEPKNIQRAISELVRVSKKKIILIEQNYGGNYYTFIHNYRKTLKHLNINIVEYNTSKKLELDLIYAEVR